MHPSERPPTVDPARARRAIGAMFFSIFGGAWLVLGSFRALPGRGAVLVLCIILIALGAVAILSRAVYLYRENREAFVVEAEAPAKQRADRLFNLINGGQWVLILIVGNVLANVGLSAWVLPSAIFIIGLHLLPLASILSNPTHYVTGGALMLLAIAYPFLASGGPSHPVGCLGAGIILWGSALWAVMDHASPRIQSCR